MFAKKANKRREKIFQQGNHKIPKKEKIDYKINYSSIQLLASNTTVKGIFSVINVV